MYSIEHATPELFTSLAKAQGEIENASKNAANPHFKSKYADLAEVLNTIRPVFATHGLSLIQSPSYDGALAHVNTILAHAGGGYITTTASCVPAKSDAQGIGSATTYLRRYSAAAVAGIAQEDDDGNAAAHNKKPAPVQEIGRPTDGAWDAMDATTQSALLKLAAKVVGAINDPREDIPKEEKEAQAHALIEREKLSSEEKIALWTQLGSGVRSALKRAQSAAKSQQKEAA